MKRLLLLMAAVASVTAATPPAALASARNDQDRDRGRESADRGRGERRDDDRGRGRDEDAARSRAPVLGYGDDRSRYAPRPRYEPRPRDDDRPRYGDGPRPRGFASPPPAARRGGYLPRNFGGEIVDDYRRYRLRTPPAGFAWVRVGNGFALVSMADGQIFDMVQ
ncbi:RcnB family protein [Phenylobacterium sp.]|uniref:RcnB family protein n=1 Tax=Phenylobacterium sp. TaxID=1871053 RepID=UPI003D2E99A2